MFLTLSLALLQASQQAPYGQPGHSVAPQTLDKFSATISEDFEAPTLAVGTAIVVGGAILDDSTILSNGEGPGMVMGGCTYTASTDIQWNGQGWFGQFSETILSVSGPLTLTYDSPQSSISLTVNAFGGGYGDTATVSAYNASGALVDQVAGISIPDENQIPVSLSGAGITSVVVEGIAQSWSPLIDNHVYSSSNVSEGFEAYSIASGDANVMDVTVLDDTSFVNGQGPNLVMDGATYSSGSLQWNGDAWFGQTSRNITGNAGGQIVIDYDYPQSDVSFTLNVYDGFPDDATVMAYDNLGNLVTTVGPVGLPDASPVAVNLSGSTIQQIVIQGANYSWSPILDNHQYDDSVYPLTLTASGPCPGLMTFNISGGIPNNFCRVLYAFGNSGSIISTGPCAGFYSDLSAPIKGFRNFRFDAAGNVSFQTNIPAAACGAVSVQVIQANCALSNVVDL